MKHPDDALTIDLYAAPVRRVADDFHLDLGDDSGEPDLIVDTNKTTGFSVDIEHAKRPFTSVKELDTAKQELAVIPENTRLRHGGVDENEIALAYELGVNLAQDGLELVQDAATSMGKAVTFLVKSGLELIAAKGQAGEGNFKDYLKQVGIPENRAYEAVSYAKFAARLEPKEREKYLLLPKKSALLLANAEPALVEFLLEDGNEELARKLRKRSELVELARELTETEDALNRHAKENDLLHKEIKALKEANEIAVAGSEYPAAVVQLRKEASVLTDEAIAALSSIRHHADNFDYLGITGDPDRGERNKCAALYPAIANVASILTAAQTLLQDLTDKYEVDLNTVAGFTHVTFPDSELRVIEAAREMMLSRKKGKSALRQAEYANSGELTRGRGRPSKAT